MNHMQKDKGKIQVFYIVKHDNTFVLILNLHVTFLIFNIFVCMCRSTIHWQFMCEPQVSTDTLLLTLSVCHQTPSSMLL